MSIKKEPFFDLTKMDHIKLHINEEILGSEEINENEFILDELKEKYKQFVKIELLGTINGKTYVLNGFYDALIGFLNSDLMKPKYLDDAFIHNNKMHFFYPFTCSCGVPGCDSIWNGIDIKIRKHTIEWRANKEDGYGFLEKEFYKFKRDSYEGQVRKVLLKLLEMVNKNNGKIYSFDYDFQNTLKEDLLLFKKSKNKIFCDILKEKGIK